MKVTQAAKELLAEKGYDPTFGARPLQRVIQTMVEDTLSEEILARHYHEGDTILVDVENDEIVVRTEAVLASS